MIDKLPDMIDAGIDSLKVEGRMKTALYVASVAGAYRNAIDDYFESPQIYNDNIQHYLNEIRSCTYRSFTRGFFYDKPNEESQIYDNNTYNKGAVYLGTVDSFDENGLAVFEQKNKFCVGDTIEIMKFNGMNEEATVERILSDEGVEQESAPHARQILHVKLSKKAEAGQILRQSQA